MKIVNHCYLQTSHILLKMFQQFGCVVLVDAGVGGDGLELALCLGAAAAAEVAERIEVLDILNGGLIMGRGLIQ